MIYDRADKKIKRLRYCDVKMDSLTGDFGLEFNKVIRLQVAAKTFAG